MGLEDKRVQDDQVVNRRRTGRIIGSLTHPRARPAVNNSVGGDPPTVECRANQVCSAILDLSNRSVLERTRSPSRMSEEGVCKLGYRSSPSEPSRRPLHADAASPSRLGCNSCRALVAAFFDDELGAVVVVVENIANLDPMGVLQVRSTGENPHLHPPCHVARLVGVDPLIHNLQRLYRRVVCQIHPDALEVDCLPWKMILHINVRVALDVHVRECAGNGGVIFDTPVGIATITSFLCFFHCAACGLDPFWK